MRVLKDIELEAVAGGNDPFAGIGTTRIDFDVSWDNDASFGYSNAMYSFDFGGGKKTPPGPKPKKEGESDQTWFRRIVGEALQKLKITGEFEVSFEQRNADGSSTVIKGKGNVHNQ